MVMVHSDFIAVHRPTSADASLHNNWAFWIFVCTVRVVAQKTSVGRHKTMEVWMHHKYSQYEYIYIALQVQVMHDYLH